MEKAYKATLTVEVENKQQQIVLFLRNIATESDAKKLAEEKCGQYKNFVEIKDIHEVLLYDRKVYDYIDGDLTVTCAEYNNVIDFMHYTEPVFYLSAIPLEQSTKALLETVDHYARERKKLELDLDTAA